MTRFNINRCDRSPEEWSAIAFKTTTENNIQWNIAGGLVVAAIAASATSSITGLLIAGWTVFSSIKKARQIQRNQLAIRQYGCIAHVLEPDDFRSYLRQVGSDAVVEELAFAQEEGFTLSNTALDYLEDYQYQSAPALEQERLQEPRQALPSRLEVSTQSSVHKTSNVFDIVKAIVSPVQNCIILGVGGSGKGIVVSNALRRIKAENPNRKIFYIDPKNEPGEYGYLEGVVDVVERKTCKNKSAEEICEWLDEVLDAYIKWENENEETLLVVDEGMVIGDACKKTKNVRIGTLILHIASLGGAAKHNAWVITQTPYVGAMGMNLTQSSQMKWVTLIGANDMGVLKQWSKSANLENISLDRLGTLTQESPVKRAVYWGGHSKWYALPRYPNYSAIDRDNNKPTGDALTTEQRGQLRGAFGSAVGAAIASKAQATQALLKLLEDTVYLTIEDFVIKELRRGDRLADLKPAIISEIRTSDRADLLEKFGLD